MSKARTRKPSYGKTLLGFALIAIGVGSGALSFCHLYASDPQDHHAWVGYAANWFSGCSALLVVMFSILSMRENREQFLEMQSSQLLFSVLPLIEDRVNDINQSQYALIKYLDERKECASVRRMEDSLENHNPSLMQASFRLEETLEGIFCLIPDGLSFGNTKYILSYLKKVLPAVLFKENSWKLLGLNARLIEKLKLISSCA